VTLDSDPCLVEDENGEMWWEGTNLVDSGKRMDFLKEGTVKESGECS